MNNRIYQSPDMYTVLSNRLVRIIRPPTLSAGANDICHIAHNTVLFANVAGYLTKVQARLHTKDWFRVAYHGGPFL